MNNILSYKQKIVNKGKEYLSACFVVANVLLAPPPAHDGSPGTARYAPPASSVIKNHHHHLWLLWRCHNEYYGG